MWMMAASPGGMCGRHVWVIRKAPAAVTGSEVVRPCAGWSASTHSGDGSCCLRHVAPRQSPCSCLTGKLVEAHTQPRNTRPPKHPTCQVGVNDPPPVCHSCLWCVWHVWVGNAGAASNGNDVWGWRQQGTASQPASVPGTGHVGHQAAQRGPSNWQAKQQLQGPTSYRPVHAAFSSLVDQHVDFGRAKMLAHFPRHKPHLRESRTGRWGNSRCSVASSLEPSQTAASRHCATQGRAAANHACPTPLSCHWRICRQLGSTHRFTAPPLLGMHVHHRLGLTSALLPMSRTRCA